MAGSASREPFVRSEDAPRLPPPPSLTGVTGWLRQNLFSNWWNGVLTLAFGWLVLSYAWSLFDWAVLRAVWTGSDREACLPETTGFCWPLVFAKLPQWIYGFFPIDERWRVNVVLIAGGLALAPMMVPSIAYKRWNLLFLLLAYPVLALILLTGGHMGFSGSTYGAMLALMLLGACLVPLALLGVEDAVQKNRGGTVLAGLAGLAPALAFLLAVLAAAAVVVGGLAGLAGLGTAEATFAGLAETLGTLNGQVLAIPGLAVLSAALLLAAAGLSLRAAWRADRRAAQGAVRVWLAAGLGLLAAMALLDVDFGLAPVETAQWGGLLLTLVVSVTGIAASLPIGVLLALGRRSRMPALRLFAAAFIELWRGVPLVAVLFMSSVMLPLFLPAGMNFDKLLRALIGVGLFSAAYMAEVVRGGLQAIPKGQYEGAMALGLSYWQTMGKVILPQALKISIPNIVGNFISLFKDTTLVSIIGLFDLLGIVRASLTDAKWASPASAGTGYFTLAAIFWVFCFGMSRYSMFMERRFGAGQKR
jgi:general L-amino acid transport system permease protein